MRVLCRYQVANTGLVANQHRQVAVVAELTVVVPAKSLVLTASIFDVAQFQLAVLQVSCHSASTCSRKAVDSKRIDQDLDARLVDVVATAVQVINA